MTVAQTIIEQLGNGRFIAMTGAKNFIGSEDSVTFKIGRNEKKVTHVRITLDPMDLYTVECLNVRNFNIKEISSTEHVYADQLRAIFESETGMLVSL